MTPRPWATYSRDDSCVGSNSDTSYDPSSNQLTDSIGGNLQDGPDNDRDCAEVLEDSLSAKALGLE